MKVKSSIKRRCLRCRIVRRRGRRLVICPVRRHNQRQG